VCDPRPQGEKQTLDIGTKEERESTQHGLGENRKGNCLYENDQIVREILKKYTTASRHKI
jgi:hypothetical protein